MTEEVTKVTNEWAFPSMESTDDEANFIESTTIRDESNTSAALSVPETKKMQKDIKSEQLQQLEVLKSEYEQKLALLSNVIQNIENSFSNLDDELSLVISNMIKTAIKKIILKEINLDPNLINNMIDELKQITKSNTSICNVFISKYDYDLLGLDKEGSIIKVDNNLKSGDVIIRSNSSEVRAILDDRIDKLLGINNE